MLIKSRYRLPLATDGQEAEFPLLRLRTAVLFPHNLLTIQVRRKETLRLIGDCRTGGRQFVAAFSPHSEDETEPTPVHQMATLATLRDCREAPGGSTLVTIEGLKRVALMKVTGSDAYSTATVQNLELDSSDPKTHLGRMDAVMAMVDEITRLDPSYSAELVYILKAIEDDPSLLADRVAAFFHIPLVWKQELLEAVDLQLRYGLLLGHLDHVRTQALAFRSLKDVTGADGKGGQYIPWQPAREPQRYREDDNGQAEEAFRVREVINRSSLLPPEVKARATIEVDRLSRLSSASAEYGVTKDYLDWILALPWGRMTPESYEIADVEHIISTDYFGPTSIKEQILQRLSVRKLSGGVDEGPTLCLVGAPGTGKASLAKAIARSLGKEFIRISVGGISEVAEIKGTPRTFLGAQPGKIIRAMRDAGSSDPVILIEDIDYFNLDNNSSVNMALLEVVDTRFNARFMDSYLGVPFDLSRVFFICSVRAFEEIPEQFVPRFELMEVPGYIEREKIVITKKYIIPSVLKKHGLRKAEFKIAEKTLARIISNYTQEAGLLGFSQQIEKICRKIALEKAEGKRKSWMVSEKNLESYLGSPIYIPERAEKAPEIGTATGLAWTGAGGDLMFIEGLKMKGEGTIITTGSLGEVMKESIQAAHSYVRSKSDMLGIDFADFSDFDIHIHFPSGAIPKDGPSAGVTVCLVVASVMSERPIRNDVAMTGEVTLRGKVLPVGGVKEKVSAAYRAGIFHIVLPKENQKDIKDIPREIQRKTKFSYIERVDELFELCLLDFKPSSYTLEKIFAEEIEKAKKKKKPIKKPAKKKHPKAARSRKK